jgi:hypothetical protein
LGRSINLPLLNVGTQENPATDGHYGNRTHRGLIYEWESPRARILWHADEIYAIAYTDPVFSVDAAGSALGEAASQRLFFETYWPSPRTLQQWGFIYRPQLVFPDSGFGANSRGRFEDYADYGWMGGHWQRSDRLEAYLAGGGALDENYRQMYGDLASQYHLETLYQTCGWDLVSRYAQYGEDGRAVFDDYLRARYSERQRAGLPVTQFRSLDEYWNRAVACVNAHGGPARVRELHAHWEENRGFPEVSLASSEALTTIDPSVVLGL